MDLIQLKVPPDRAALIADAIEFCIEDGKYANRERELSEILVWLRYRVQRWNQNHPTDPTA